MRLRIAICDDEQNQIEYIQSAVLSWAETASHSCEISSFPSSEAFLFEYSEHRDFDILLLDVEMNGMNGVDLAKQLRHEGNRAEIIFITSHFEFYGEGYEVDALHYLIKPIARDKLAGVLTKAADRLAEEPPSVIISCNGETFKLFENDILYVESFLHYISIHTKDREYRVKENLSALEKKLTGTFYRIHRSYLASLKHITRISRSTVIIAGQTELPLARGKYDDINRAYIEHN